MSVFLKKESRKKEKQPNKKPTPVDDKLMRKYFLRNSAKWLRNFGIRSKYVFLIHIAKKVDYNYLPNIQDSAKP